MVALKMLVSHVRIAEYSVSKELAKLVYSSRNWYISK
jgi:hypothetical protein